jgi:hypothetical protein
MAAILPAVSGSARPIQGGSPRHQAEANVNEGLAQSQNVFSNSRFVDPNVKKFCVSSEVFVHYEDRDF